MSRARPSQRDRIEKEYLSYAKQRSDIEDKMIALQKELERIESPRLNYTETAPRKDALDLLPERRFATLPDLDEPQDDISTESDTIDWKSRCVRITAMTVGLLRRVAYADKRPRLEAFCGLFALDVDCESMRSVALSESVSIEWVSQKTEQIQQRFNLPKNHHNKSAQAVKSYRHSAKLQAMA